MPQKSTKKGKKESKKTPNLHINLYYTPCVCVCLLCDHLEFNFKCDNTSWVSYKSTWMRYKYVALREYFSFPFFHACIFIFILPFEIFIHLMVFFYFNILFSLFFVPFCFFFISDFSISGQFSTFLFLITCPLVAANGWLLGLWYCRRWNGRGHVDECYQQPTITTYAAWLIDLHHSIEKCGQKMTASEHWLQHRKTSYCYWEIYF